MGSFDTAGNCCPVKPALCSFCEQRSATAYWTITVELQVCAHCAVTTLPALIADAIPVGTGKQPHTSLAAVQASFWRALALRLNRLYSDPL
jgi:hypothetical protein